MEMLRRMSSLSDVGMEIVGSPAAHWYGVFGLGYDMCVCASVCVFSFTLGAGCEGGISDSSMSGYLPR